MWIVLIIVGLIGLVVNTAIAGSKKKVSQYRRDDDNSGIYDTNGRRIN